MTPEYSARNAAAPPEESAAIAVLLPLASIDSSPLNPRKYFDDEDLQRLAVSLQSDGLCSRSSSRRRVIAIVLWPANVVGARRSD